MKMEKKYAWCVCLGNVNNYLGGRFKRKLIASSFDSAYTKAKKLIADMREDKKRQPRIPDEFSIVYLEFDGEAYE